MMEGLPRVPMISLPIKKSPEVPDLDPMKKDIEIQYQHSRDVYEKEFIEFLIIRHAACAPSIDYVGLTKMKRYYAQLQLLKGRFRFSSEDGTAVGWKWVDIFTNALKESNLFRFEEASVLFNIGALQTILGTKENRSDANSMKTACTRFQCAAWALENVFERHALSDISTDLNTEVLRSLSSIMIAQAQECILEKSLLDNRPANTNAKLSQYLAQIYDQISQQLSVPSTLTILPSKYQKDLFRRCQVKSAYYGALVAYHCAAAEQEAGKHGNAIAYYQSASRRINEAESVVKDVKETDPLFPTSPGGSLRNNVQFMSNIIQTKLTSAVKDNDFIYHETVPNVEALELVKSACLVKGVPFDHKNQEVRGPDIFQRLIPMKTLEAASVYSECKASLLRKIAAEVEDKDVALQQFLTGLDLDPETMFNPDPPIPQEFYDVCARISQLERGPEKELSEQMQTLALTSMDVESEVQTIHEKAEELIVRTDALLMVKPTDDLRVLKSRLVGMPDRLNSIHETLNLAKQSNLQLREVLSAHVNALKRIKAPVDEIIAELPSVKPIVENDEVLAIQTEAKRLFGKLDEMTRQRIELIDRLRQALHNDDITGDLLVSDPSEAQDSLEALFEIGLKKHDALVALIRQNLTAQDNIESALLDLNAKFSPKASELSEIRSKRSDNVRQLVSCGQKFDELLDKCAQGQKFYTETGNRMKEMMEELDSGTEKLMKAEEKLTSLSSITRPAVTNIGQTPPMFTPSNVVATSPASGSISTLGDYMAALRMQQRPPVPQPMRPSTTNIQYQYPPAGHQQQQQQMNSPHSTTPSNLPPQPPMQSQPQTAGAFPQHRPPHAYAPTQSTQPYTVQSSQTPQGTSYPPHWGQYSGAHFGQAPALPNVNQRPSSAFPVYGAPQGIQHVPHPHSTHQSPFQASPHPPVSAHAPHSLGSSPIPQGPIQAPQPYTTSHQMPPSNQFPQIPTAWQSIPQHQAYPPYSSTPSRPFLPTPTSQLPPSHVHARPSQQPPIPIQQTVPQGEFHSLPHPMTSGPHGAPPTASSLHPSTSVPPSYGVQHQQTGVHMVLPHTRVPLQQPVSSTPMSNMQNIPGQTPFRPYIPTPPSFHPGPQPHPPQMGHPPVNTVPSTTHVTPVGQHPLPAPQQSYPHTQASNTSQSQVNQNQNFSSNFANYDAVPNKPPILEDVQPLKPHVLTQADLDTQRREERLRATFSPPYQTDNAQPLNPQQHTTPTNAGLAKVLSESTSGPPSTHSESVQMIPTGIKLLSDPLVLNRFITATERLLTWLDVIDSRSTSDSLSPAKPSSTKLEISWNKVMSIVSEHSELFKGKKPTQAAALCCPGKNRSQVYVPYDANRVVLNSATNDYINASLIDFSGSLGDWCPRYIMVQAPIPKTVNDYWIMLIEQCCEVVVSLIPPRVHRSQSPFSVLTSSGVNNQGEGAWGDPSDPLHIPTHLPPNKLGARFQSTGSPIEVRLQAIKEFDQDGVHRTQLTSPEWTERILTVHNASTQQTRSMVHLSFHGTILDSNLSSMSSMDKCTRQFNTFLNHVHDYYRQQRNLVHPIAVVCPYGAGLSGIFVLSSVGLLHIDMTGSLVDLEEVAGRLCQQRRGALNQSVHLVSAARAIGQAAVDILARRDVVVGPRRKQLNSAVGASPLVSHPPVCTKVNPVDTIFSDQPVQFDQLLSVVDKWSISTNAGESSNIPLDEEHTCCPEPVKPTEEPVTETLITDAWYEKSSNPDPTKPTDVSHFDNLVDLADLSTSNGQTKKRFTRRDFEPLSDISTVPNVPNLNNVFAGLDGHSTGP